ncbi:AMP deaminase-like protein [Tanacetum coccineum]
MADEHLPRLYNIYKEIGIVKSFQTILDNVNPSSHPELDVFLKQVWLFKLAIFSAFPCPAIVGLDLVDDESKPERCPYYIMSSEYLDVMSQLHESKGMNTIRFRPHCGEAGDNDHLAAAFLTTHNFAHGINLRKSPMLQYLYYLSFLQKEMDKLRQCMSLVYSLKSKVADTIGQYGDGFKTSAIWLGADFIVFTWCPTKNEKRSTQSIGLLSYTFLRVTGKEDIVVPMLKVVKGLAESCVRRFTSIANAVLVDGWFYTGKMGVDPSEAEHRDRNFVVILNFWLYN